MKFAIISHVIHKPVGEQYFAYEPYVREMNLWSKHVDELIIVAPISYEDPLRIEAAYTKNEIHSVAIPNFDLTSIANKVKSLFLIPIVLFRIFGAMRKADHIHLRCPGNIGLLGCIVQILFPGKPKTAKYAGNWDPKSKQPLSYRIQKRILSNTFLTRNIKVLVYGEWENQTKNIVPFFTASYSGKEKKDTIVKDLKGEIRFLYVGGLIKSKQPMLTLKVILELHKKGYNVKLDVYGDGEQMKVLKNFIKENDMETVINLHGNQSKSTVKQAYIKSHFIVFISRSEGWPKVIAESMFFKCLPISSSVSCVPFMLDNGKRGSLIREMKVSVIVNEVESYLTNEKVYLQKTTNALNWSQQYTLEYFDKQIERVLHD